MFLLGLILPVCFIPGLTGASIPTQWVLLSVVLPCFLWRPITLGPAHWLGLLALAYAGASFFWSISHYDALWGLWLIFIWALGFRLGSTALDLRELFRGLAYGLTINSGVALIQWLGYSPFLTDGGCPGILYNTTVLGASAALVILGLLHLGYWHLVPGVALGLVLSGSRGAWLALAVGLLARRLHWSLLALGVLCLGGYFSLALSHSDALRLYLWSIAGARLTLFGNGIGSFTSLYYIATDLLFNSPVRLVRPEFVHNDYLQLWFELGIGALPIYAIYAICLRHTAHPQWPFFVAFATLSTFYFPLWCPLTSFIGCVVAGRCVASWHHAGCPGFGWRPHFLSRPRRQQPSDGLVRGQAVPI